MRSRIMEEESDDNDHDEIILVSATVALGILAIVCVIIILLFCFIIRKDFAMVERDRRINEEKDIFKSCKDPDIRMLVIKDKIVERICFSENISSPPRPYRKYSIGSVETQGTCDDSDNDEDEDDDNLCSVCLEPFEPQQEAAWSRDKACLHCFHSKCLLVWLMEHQDCPCCRKNLLKKKDFMRVYKQQQNSEGRIIGVLGVNDNVDKDVEDQSDDEKFVIVDGQVVFGAVEGNQEDHRNS